MPILYRWEKYFGYTYAIAARFEPNGVEKEREGERDRDYFTTRSFDTELTRVLIILYHYVRT